MFIGVDLADSAVRQIRKGFQQISVHQILFMAGAITGETLCSADPECAVAFQCQSSYGGQAEFEIRQRGGIEWQPVRFQFRFEFRAQVQEFLIV